MRSRSWHYHWWYSIIACIMTSNLVACRSVEDTQTPNIEYRAYGKKWSYFTVEHYKREWGFDSAFRFFGLREGIAQDVYLCWRRPKIDQFLRVVPTEN